MKKTHTKWKSTLLKLIYQQTMVRKAERKMEKNRNFWERSNNNLLVRKPNSEKIIRKKQWFLKYRKNKNFYEKHIQKQNVIL